MVREQVPALEKAMVKAEEGAAALQALPPEFLPGLQAEVANLANQLAELEIKLAGGGAP